MSCDIFLRDTCDNRGYLRFETVWHYSRFLETMRGCGIGIALPNLGYILVPTAEVPKDVIENAPYVTPLDISYIARNNCDASLEQREYISTMDS